MENSSLKLIVKPVPRASAQNRHLQEAFYRKDGQILETKPLGKNKATIATGESCIDQLVFTLDDSRTKFSAGMSEQIPNPWYDREDEESLYSMYNLGEKWRNIMPKLIKQKKISKQQELEIKAGVEPGTYTEVAPPKLPGSPFFDPSGEQTELMKFKLVLYDRANVFRDNTPRQRLAIQLLRNRTDRIAQSREEINTAEHTFYIAEEFEEFKISKLKNDMVNKAIAKLFMLQEKYPTTNALEENVLYQIASICTDGNERPIVKGRVTNLFVEQEVNSYIKSKSRHQVSNVEKFLESIELFEKNRTLFFIRLLTQQAFNVSTVSISNGYLFWHSNKHKPDWYRFTSRENFETFLFTQFEQYNPKEPATENGYKQLTDELIQKDAIVPKT